MVKTKHTPGPWEVWKGHFDVYAGVVENTRSGLTGAKGKPMPRIAACEDDAELSESEMKANAQLISAAPDLLAAAERMVSDQNRPVFSMDFKGAIDELIAAIAKAKGETK